METSGIRQSSRGRKVTQSTMPAAKYLLLAAGIWQIDWMPDAE
jgi:hypothetical protein